MSVRESNHAGKVVLRPKGIKSVVSSPYFLKLYSNKKFSLKRHLEFMDSDAVNKQSHKRVEFYYKDGLQGKKVMARLVDIDMRWTTNSNNPNQSTPEDVRDETVVKSLVLWQSKTRILDSRGHAVTRRTTSDIPLVSYFSVNMDNYLKTLIQEAQDVRKKIMAVQTDEQPAPITVQQKLEEVLKIKPSLRNWESMKVTLECFSDASKDMYTAAMVLITSMLGRDNISKVLNPTLFMTAAGFVVSNIYEYRAVVLMFFLNFMFFGTIKTHMLEFGEKKPKPPSYYALRSIWKFKGYRGNLIQDCLMMVGFFTLLATAMSAIGKFFKEDKKQLTIEASEFMIESPYNKPLNLHEVEVSSGRSFKRLPNKLGEQWVNTQTVATSGLHKSNPVDLFFRVSKNLRHVTVIDSDGNCTAAHCLGIKGSVAIINSHMWQGMKFPIEIRFRNVNKHDYSRPEEGTHFSSRLYGKKDIYEVGNDITLINTQCLFRDIICHFPKDSDFMVTGADCLREDGIVKPYVMTNRNIATKIGDKNIIGFVTSHRHAVGLCGIPYIIRKGQGYCVASIHAAGLDNDAFSALVLQPDIDQMYTKIVGTSTTKVLASQGEIDLVLEDPIAQSCVHYENMSGLTIYGKLPGPVNVQGKSAIVKNHIYDLASVENFLFEEFGHVKQIEYGKPLMGVVRSKEFKSPYNLGARKFSREHKPIDWDIMSAIVEDEVDIYVEHFKRVNPDVSLNPLDLEVAINGDFDDAYISRVNPKTSGGFNFSGNKGRYLPIVHEEPGFVKREPDEKLKERLLKCLDIYKSGNTCSHIYNVALKDEPRDVEKVKQGKTRLFFVAPLDLIILSRMFFAPFYSMFAAYPFEFYTAIGINMHKQAGEVYNFLVDFAENIMETDYQAFDMSMNAEIRLAAYMIQVKILRRLGYTRDTETIMTALVSDLLFPIFNMCSDVMMVPGAHPSGGDGTAQHNSIVNKLMIRYFYSFVQTHNKVGIDRKSKYYFYDLVRPITLGDDQLTAVKDEVASWMNNVNFAKFCTDMLGIKCTPASKGAELTPFVSKEDMVFLKRRFVFHKDLGRIVGKLDLDSLLKTLTWRMPSTELEQPEYQVLSAAGSVAKEFVFHANKSQYERFCEFLINGLLSYGCWDRTFIISQLLTYEQQLAALSITMETQSEVISSIAEMQCLTSYRPHGKDVAQSDANSDNEREVCNPTLCSVMGSGSQLLYPSNSDLIESLKKHLNKLDAEYEEQKGEEKPLTFEEYTRRRNELMWHIQKLLACKTTFPVESDMLESKGATSVEENMINIGGEETEVVGMDAMRRNTFIVDDSQDLDDFPRRPIRIAEYVWTDVSSFAVNSHRPWNIVTLDPALRAKLKNKAFIRATLVIEANLSGSILQRGKVRLAYFPWGNYNPHLGDFAFPIDNKKLAKKYLAQAPFNVLMDVRDNKPARMRIPWSGTAPMARLFNEQISSIATGTSFLDVQDLGVLFVAVQNTIVNSSNSPNFPDVTLEIFSWLEDVELGGATATQLALATESELKKGPVENFAMSTAKFMSSLSEAPVIGPYAKASEMAAKGLGTLAAHHGWSEPQKPFVVTRIRQDGLFNEAHVIGQSFGRKLTLDPLQETSIDPSVCGSNIDETGIENISSRWGLVSTFRWEPTNSANVMFSAAITPAMTELDTKVVGPTSYQRAVPIPACFATGPFQYWRGDCEIKLEFVKGSMDRGKLSFKFEPNLDQSTLIMAATDSLNKQNLILVDLATTDEITLKINWNSNYEWLELPTRQQRQNTVNFSDYSQLRDSANGFIYIRPFTKIVTPDDDGIDVNVYVRFTNVKVAAPTLANLPTDSRTYATQGDSYTLFDYGTTDKNILTDYFGETVPNLRMLLKRYWNQITYQSTAHSEPAGVGRYLYWSNNVYPTYLRYTAGTPNMWNYMRPAYIGFKGSMRKRIIPFSTNPGNNSVCRVMLAPPTTTNLSQSLSSAINHDGGFMLANLIGTTTFVPQSTGLEFDIPYYNRNLYLPSQITDLTTLPNMVKRRFLRDVKCSLSSNEAFNNTVNSAIIVETAVGEDFVFMMFSGSPWETDVIVS
uniref:Genome polyprotein n=1 Tax=Perth bee virus 9 TaxID=2201303 RepID=A0A2U8JQC4_9VIRU|nr:polyprotein [Perth bee virus 9]